MLPLPLQTSGCHDQRLSGGSRGITPTSAATIDAPGFPPPEDVRGQGCLHPAMLLRAHVPLYQDAVLVFAIRFVLRAEIFLLGYQRVRSCGHVQVQDTRISRSSLDALVNVATALGCRVRIDIEAA